MVLIDRLARDNDLPPDQRVSGHLFEAALWLWLRGHITKQAVVTTFSLDVADSAKLDEFQTTFNAKNPAVEKIAYFADVTSALVGLQQGKITKALFKTIVGII